MPPVYPEPSVSKLPSGEDLNRVYQIALNLARNRLDSPLSVTINTWEDGEVEVRAWHKYPLHERGRFLKGVVRLHTREGATGAILLVDVNTDKETLIEKWCIDSGSVVADATGEERRPGNPPKSPHFRL